MRFLYSLKIKILVKNFTSGISFFTSISTMVYFATNQSTRRINLNFYRELKKKIITLNVDHNTRLLERNSSSLQQLFLI